MRLRDIASAGRRHLPIAFPIALAALVAACGSGIQTQLPPIDRLTGQVLTPMERNLAIDQMVQRSATHEQDTVRAIEGARQPSP